MVNTVNVQKVIDLINRLPDKAKGVNMTCWSMDGIDPNRPENGLMIDLEQAIECGTACCIGGWSDMIRAQEMGMKINLQRNGSIRFFNSEGEPTLIFHEGETAQWLGLDEHDSYKLFYAANSPYYLEGLRYNHVLRVLEHLRDTGRVDWSERVVDYSDVSEKASRKPYDEVAFLEPVGEDL
jgi:hypothetical protein